MGIEMLVPDMWAKRGRYRELTKADIKRIEAAGGCLRNGMPEHYICAARGCRSLVPREGMRCGAHDRGKKLEEE